MTEMSEKNMFKEAIQNSIESVENAAKDIQKIIEVTAKSIISNFEIFFKKVAQETCELKKELCVHIHETIENINQTIEKCFDDISADVTDVTDDTKTTLNNQSPIK